MKNIHLAECEWLPIEQMKDSTVLVTGGTGLIGFNLIYELSKISENMGIKILAFVRDIEKARKRFSEGADGVVFVQGDVTKGLTIEEPIHYIIHGASLTSSDAFVNKPVETILTAVIGTQNVLELAQEKRVRSMVYLSSMEMYGSSEKDETLHEENVGYLDPLQIRSSYPESKRLCESLCSAYMHEYGVPVRIARLAQTFGPGIPSGDRRAVVQFIKNALNHEDIQIKASGKTARMYLYTFDAVTAILTLLLRGKSGEAYNVANRETYCSIQSLAEMVMQVVGEEGKVLVGTGTEEERRVYPPDTYLRLDTNKIESLGWMPMYSLKESILSLAQNMEE